MLLLAFAFSSVKNVYAIPFMLLVVVVVWLLSGLRASYVLKHLFYPSFFVLFLALALLLFGGKTVIYNFGFLTITSEGLQAATLLVARFYCILTLAISFFSVSPLLTNIAAMRSLKMPYIIVDMALLMMRYLEVLKQDMHNMSVSMRLRGHKDKAWSLKTIKTSAWLAASLLVRSYEHAEGVYKAMRLRGYGQKNSFARQSPPDAIDWLFFVLVILITLGFFILA